MSLESEVELIRRLPLFAKIDLAMLKLLCFSSERLTFEVGQVVFNAGDVADAAYILIDGYVAISRPTPTGPVVVGTLGPMEIVGEIAIFGDVPRTATITATSGAVTASDTLVIRGASLIEIKFQPSRVRGPQATTMTVTLDTVAPVGDAVITLVWSDPTLIQGGAPTSITIFAGQTSRSVNLITRRVSRTLATQVSATYGTSTRFAVLTVTR